MTVATQEQEEQIEWLVRSFGPVIYKVAFAITRSRALAEEVVQDALFATSATSRPQNTTTATLADKPTTHWLETNKPSLQQTQCDSNRHFTQRHHGIPPSLKAAFYSMRARRVASRGATSSAMIEGRSAAGARAASPHRARPTMKPEQPASIATSSWAR